MASGYSDVVRGVLTVCMLTYQSAWCKTKLHVDCCKNLKFHIHSLSLWWQWCWHVWGWLW